MGIRHLPIELLGIIVGNIDLQDLFHLSLTCRQFHYLVKDQSLMRQALEREAAYSPEACTALATRDYARGARRLIKRRTAIAESRPFLAAVLAVADGFIFHHSVIVYMADREWLRLLDLSGPTHEEIVVHTRSLLDAAIEESQGTKKFKFLPLYYADGFLSCLYTHAFYGVATSWLLVFEPQTGQITTVYQLDSSIKLFVRNNRKFLYFGAHSEYGEDGFRRWVLKGFDIQNKKWIPHKILLSDFVGADIDVNICFEIIDDYFYGISNETAFEVEEIDWTSCYYGCRFPLDDPSPGKMETTAKEDMWRRQNAEGPIDDRWGLLKLEKDERTGELMIHEGRTEWLAANSGGQRTFYQTKLIFRDKVDDADQSSQTGSSPGSVSGLALPANDPLTRLINPSRDKPTYQEPGQRLPRYVHRADNGSTLPMFTLSQCSVRSYLASCGTWLDVVHDKVDLHPARQVLRLRVGSRRLRRSCVEPASPKIPQSDAKGIGPSIDDEIERLYEPNEIRFWPPVPETTGRSDFQQWEELQWILNPTGPPGDVQGVQDQQSLVYMTGGGGRSRMKAMILISWDPGLRLKGLRRWKSGGSAAQGAAVSSGAETCMSKVAGSGKGKEKELDWDPQGGRSPERGLSGDGQPSGATCGLPSASKQENPDLPSWVRRAPAMYFDIPMPGAGPWGFDFTL